MKNTFDFSDVARVPPDLTRISQVWVGGVGSLGSLGGVGSVGSLGGVGNLGLKVLSAE
ncbi:hypothetical protein H6G80_01930 [Nostoc sp. FACHB-87]|uniref:hypothetical protein n=1 Tax=Nostocaceae TaxID=1162 RepID=UPI0016886794|nr:MULTISPECIES: hypothetical protein [Nostocaceae]MBD2452861.1 hypothetical protein [Nostoc sp. FACHB-87]MBD2473792.1 hypothetical protein [Anabaena sp. FACHB-83]